MAKDSQAAALGSSFFRTSGKAVEALRNCEHESLFSYPLTAESASNSIRCRHTLNDATFGCSPSLAGHGFQERQGMKVLLSAYACEPNKGSEPAVGWNWALALTRRGYDVHVITRSNNRAPIKQAHHPAGLATDVPLLRSSSMAAILEALAWRYLCLLPALADRGLSKSQTAACDRAVRYCATHYVCLVSTALLHGRTWRSVYLRASGWRGSNAKAISQVSPITWQIGGIAARHRQSAD